MPKKQFTPYSQISSIELTNSDSVTRQSQYNYDKCPI
jgi:hypothetical protein